MAPLTIQRVTASFDSVTFRLRFTVCHSSGTSLTADGVKCAFQALRLFAFCDRLSVLFIRVRTILSKVNQGRVIVIHHVYRPIPIHSNDDIVMLCERRHHSTMTSSAWHGDITNCCWIRDSLRKWLALIQSTVDWHWFRISTRIGTNSTAHVT